MKFVKFLIVAALAVTGVYAAEAESACVIDFVDLDKGESGSVTTLCVQNTVIAILRDDIAVVIPNKTCACKLVRTEDNLVYTKGIVNK